MPDSAPAQKPASTPCAACGVTRQERLLGIQMAEMLAGASERAQREAKPDDPVKTLRRMAAEFGYVLVPRQPACQWCGVALVRTQGRWMSYRHDPRCEIRDGHPDGEGSSAHEPVER